MNPNNPTPNLPGPNPPSQQQPAPPPVTTGTRGKLSVLHHVIAPLGILAVCWILAYLVFPKGTQFDKGLPTIAKILTIVVPILAVLCVVGLMIWNAVAYFRKRRGQQNAAPANATATNPTTTSTKSKERPPWKTLRDVVLILAIFWILFSPVPLRLLQGWGLAPKHASVVTAANYTTNTCDDYDQVQNEVHHEKERIGRFVVKLHEGCFPGRIYPPEIWKNKGWVYQPVGKNPDRSWWVAFWFDGKFQPEGPFFWFLGQKPWLNASDTQVFQIQGKEGQEVLFRSPAVEAELTKERKVNAKGDVVTVASLISKAEPLYTSQARNARIQGIVRLSFVIDENGEVGDIKVVKSLGYGLDEQAVESLKRWKFRPGTKNGQPVPTENSADVDFKLL